MAKVYKARGTRTGWTFNEAECRWDRDVAITAPHVTQPATKPSPLAVSRMMTQVLSALEAALHEAGAVSLQATSAAAATPAKQATPSRIDELLKLTPLGRQVPKQSPQKK